MTAPPPRAQRAAPGASAHRRLKCRFGPADGLQFVIGPDVTEVAVPAPAAGDGSARVAVYRVTRRRRGRGVAFDVLVFAGTQPAAPTEAPVAGPA